MPFPIDSKNHAARAVLRFLNGPLCGCEYHLANEVTLIVAGAESTFLARKDTQEILEFPDNAIVVPFDGGCNFEIILDASMREGFRLRTFEPKLEEKIDTFQKVCKVGPLSFALRPIDATWHSEILGSLPPTKERSPPKRSGITRILFGLITLLVLAMLAVMLWLRFGENKRVAEVAAIIDGSSEQYQLFKARDGNVYVFAESERDVTWAKQALAREGGVAIARVSTLRDEEGRISRKLLANYPKLGFYRLMLADPARPILQLSQERGQISAERQKILISSLASWMPYAEKVSLATWSDAMLDKQAHTGLDRLGVAYDRSSNGSNVTYHIRGSLGDIELAQLQSFTDNFYRSFGRRYVSFSVALEEDWLTGKSFRYGSSGYVKMAPQHWFFPQSL